MAGALTIASVLAMPQLVLAEAEKTQTLASGLADKWEKMQQSYMEFCWS
jgi:hypothetical protein